VGVETIKEVAQSGSHTPAPTTLPWSVSSTLSF
jgi:hypothetical protein